MQCPDTNQAATTAQNNSRPFFPFLGTEIGVDAVLHRQGRKVERVDPQKHNSQVKKAHKKRYNLVCHVVGGVPWVSYVGYMY